MIIIFCWVTAVSVFYVTSTQKGARLVVRVFLSKCLQFDDIRIGEEEGSFLKGLRLKQVEIRNPQELPKGSVLRMEEIRFAPLLSFKKGWLNFEIRRLRCKTPDFAEELIFKEAYGCPFGGLVLHGVKMEGLIGFQKESVLKIKKLNSLFSGGKQPVSGEFQFKALNVQGLTLTDGDASFEITQKMSHDKVTLRGEINLKRGTLLWRNNAITLTPGKIVWSGDPAEPSLDLTGNSVIGDVQITLVLKGVKSALDLRLLSDSPLSQKKLFLMLFAGKSWKNLFLAPFLKVSH